MAETMKLTRKQREILTYMGKQAVAKSPTEIGEGCGLPYHAASSWSNSGLKALISSGLAERDSTGPRYLITAAGRRALSEGGE